MHKDSTEERVYSLRELSEAFRSEGQQVSITMLKNYIKRGQLKATEVDGEYRVKESDVEWGMGKPHLEFDTTDRTYENRDQGIFQELIKATLDEEVRCHNCGEVIREHRFGHTTGLLCGKCSDSHCPQKE